MCIICLDIEKSKISPNSAQWALIEMANELDDEHYYEVLEKIEKFQEKYEFKMLLKIGDEQKTVEMCINCHCDPCDCNWGSDE